MRFQPPICAPHRLPPSHLAPPCFTSRRRASTCPAAPATAGRSAAALLLGLLAAALPAASSGEGSAGGRVPVLLELFTSEGCSSCPPADLVLAELQRGQPVPGVEVVALSEHVDYWDRLGWRDPFSDLLFTARQEAYSPRLAGGRIYTPQAVVDGAFQVSGGDATGLRRALAAAVARPRGLLRIRAAAVTPAGAGAGPGAAVLRAEVEASALPGDGEVLVALVEDGLQSRVEAGENQGRTLAHAAVVRQLRRAGRSGRGAFAGAVQLRLGPGLRRERLRLVAFVQAPGGPVLAVGTGALPP